MTEQPTTGSGSILELTAEPLTAEAFAPFGDVVESTGDAATINQGYGQRFPDLATVDVADEGGRTRISRVRSFPEPQPVQLRLMERHPLSTQAFVPVDGQRFIVVVAAAGEPPAAESFHAFLATGGQGVNYHRGIWHHPMIVVDSTCDFLTVDREGPGSNLDEITVNDRSVHVTF